MKRRSTGISVRMAASSSLSRDGCLNRVALSAQTGYISVVDSRHSIQNSACSRASGVAGYCLRSSRLWTSRRLLTHEQWDTLIQRATTYEDALINSVMTGRRPDSPDTRFIPSAVRREVWVRDGGICVQCGSKERLEFDHIIPVAMGGSNTTRNIQLLCEVCNQKRVRLSGNP